MNNTGKILTALAAGVAVGALLGVLFAPDKGSETIDKVADESKRLVEEVKDKFRRGKNKFNEMKEDIEQLDELSKGTVRSYLKKSKEQESGALGRQGATTNNDMSPIDAGDKAYEGKKRAIAKLGGSNSVLASKVPAK